MSECQCCQPDGVSNAKRDFSRVLELDPVTLEIKWMYPAPGRGTGDAEAQPPVGRVRWGERLEHAVVDLDLAADLGNGRLKRDFQLKVAAFERIKASLATRPNLFLGKVHDSVPEASFEDEAPPPSFLCSLDRPAEFLGPGDGDRDRSRRAPRVEIG